MGGGGITVASTAAELSPSFGSVVLEDKIAVFTRGSVPLTTTLKVIVARPWLVSVPMVHTTPPLKGVQLPAVAKADMKVTPAGKTLLNTTSDAASGPKLVIEMV